jgi:hypothetical protein
LSMQPVFATNACRENNNRLLQKDRLFQGRFFIKPRFSKIYNSYMLTM